MTLFSYVRMVLWSFFGIRRNAYAGEELSKAKPLGVVIAALCLAGLFGLILWSMAHLAVVALQ